jgi:subtilisin family serine protease
MQFSPAAKRRTICLVASLVAAQAANAQILGPGLGGRITEPIGRGIEEPLERLPNPQDALDPQKALERGEELAESVRGSAEETLDAAEDTASALGDDVGGVLAAALERFVPGVDRNGRRAENEVWVVLVPSEHADNIPAWGFTIRERRDLEALDRILLRIEAPDDRDIVQLGFELDADAPGTVVDFNHLYGGAQARGATSLQRNRRGNSGTSAEGVARGTPATDDAQALTVARAVTIGIIDTAVAREHEALRGAAVIERDFVPFVGERPKRHGTAVSSVAFATARSLGAAPDDVALYAACVFFDDDRGNATAATGSLVAALEWLGNAEVPNVPNTRAPGCSSENTNPLKSEVNRWIPKRREVKSKYALPRSSELRLARSAAAEFVNSRFSTNISCSPTLVSVRRYPSRTSMRVSAFSRANR